MKINTINYAREILLQKDFIHPLIREAILTRVCANRKILKIEDLIHEPDFPHQSKFVNEQSRQCIENENSILKYEQERYLQRVQAILSKNAYSDRDVLVVGLGLNNRDIFNGHQGILQKVLNNENLLKLVMVSCGKVLFAAPDNNKVIDLLRGRGVSVNSADDKGMTALHYAVQVFYVYRNEQLDLISKLFNCGANPHAKNDKDQTPLMLANVHCRKDIVLGGNNVLQLLQKNLAIKDAVNPDTTASKINNSETIILKSLGRKPGEKIDVSRKNTSHDDSSLQTTAEVKRKNEHTAPTDRTSTDDSSITYSSYRKK